MEQRFSFQYDVFQIKKLINFPAVDKEATFKSLSTEEFAQMLTSIHHFPSFIAVALAENLSMYRDDPEAWTGDADFAVRDVTLPRVRGTSTNLSLNSLYRICLRGTNMFKRRIGAHILA